MQRYLTPIDSNHVKNIEQTETSGHAYRVWDTSESQQLLTARNTTKDNVPGLKIMIALRYAYSTWSTCRFSRVETNSWIALTCSDTLLPKRGQESPCRCFRWVAADIRKECIGMALAFCNSPNRKMPDQQSCSSASWSSRASLLNAGTVEAHLIERVSTLTENSQT